MSRRGEVLGLLHGGGRFRTIRGVIRTRRDDELVQEAFRRAASGGSGRYTAAWTCDGGTGPAIEHDETVRFWVALPRRIREERVVRIGGREAVSVLVIDGPTWWSSDPALGATTNEGDLSHGHGSAIEGPILEPSVLLPASTLTVLEERTVAGQPGLAVPIRARPSLSGAPVHDLPAVGELEVVVHRERGILLSMTRILDGTPYETTELVEVAFDEAFPPDTFTFETPPGETLRTTRERHTRAYLPLHEVARLAPFTVLAAPRIPDGWELRASLHAADAGLDTPASAHLFYVAANGAARISLHETATFPGAEIPTPDGREWTSVERDERELRLWEPAGSDLELPRMILVEAEGTRMLVTSGEVGVEDLLDFAAALSPASPEAPRPT